MAKVAAVNAGSSSIKISVYEVEGAKLGAKVSDLWVTNLGQPSATMRIKTVDQPETTQTLHQISRQAATSLLIDELQKTAGDELAGIGHRIVHGGPKHFAPEVITDDLIEELQLLANYDPEHLPAALELMTATKQRFTGVTQVASFDTAFFEHLPALAKLLPLPRDLQQQGLRRYGFHGLSYSYLLAEVARRFGDKAAQSRVILAHLGSGSSLAAVNHGQPIDTTMSFTPASGVMTSTRSGDLDPGIMTYLLRQGLTPDHFRQLVNEQSGLLGVSGLTGDMYTLLQHEADNPQAKEAVDLYCYQVRRAIGSLAAALGGIDTLVFSGGIGEVSAPVRARISQGLEFLGIKIDPPASEAQHTTISVSGSSVLVVVLPTDENLMIAQNVLVVQSKRGEA